MEINGPLTIGVLDNDTGGRELHLGFKPDFRVLNLQQQSEAFQDFIKTLINEIHELDESDPNRQGMTTILQICEQLQPHIDTNELPLEETIVVNIQSHNPFGNIKISN
ncbi:MAG TPA: transcriptional regulator [Gammaproteobacteria bacterium]|nr:transcriptional regulator [Gammaproteobacteria bacterium]